MKKIVFPLILSILIACNSDSDEPSNEEKATACAIAVAICQQDPEEGGARNFCITTFASRICLGVIL